MSVSATDRDLEMLAWLAEQDMAAVKHAHAQFMAATEPEAVSDLGRTYQRMSRALRTTLMVKMKAQHARLQEQVQAELGARPALAAAQRAEVLRERQIERRTLELQAAMERVAAALIPGDQAREDALARFDLEMDVWMDDPDYLRADLDSLVLRACRLMGWSEDLATTWRKLPRPVYGRPADDLSRDGAPPSVHRRDSG